MFDGFVCTSHLVFQSHPSQVAAEKAEKDRAEAAKVKEERGMSVVLEPLGPHVSGRRRCCLPSSRAARDLRE